MLPGAPRTRSPVLLVAAALLALPSTFAAQSPSAAGLTADLLDGLSFREIGPAVAGGRIHDIEALPGDPATIYVASASGGLWKTTNKGTTWTPIFENRPVSTFGDIAIAPSNSDVIWAGTGEQNNRQSTSWGYGVYRSTDGGRTWTHLGLEDTRHIGKVEVHPQNPDIAYVAALGNLWAPSAERGVFRTTDGGRAWEKVLFVDTLTGVVDLVMDPSDPNTLYAAAYQRMRRAWGFNGGGPGSGIYKTTDGGRTWRRLTTSLPAGDMGRIGLAIARSNPRVLDAIVEADSAERGIYRTVDGGETWTRMSSRNPRPMYYSEIFLDPQNDRRVYILATSSYRSEDGGRTWTEIARRPTYDVGVHADHHALWIDPNDTRHLYLGGDGGFWESWDRGESFTRIDNLPIAQFYAIGVDMREPYWIYGGLQDNHSWAGPSATRHWMGILRDDWKQIGFGDGMYHQPDPTSHRYVYSNSNDGDLTRVDAETGDILNIRPHPPEGEEEYRFDWSTPSLISRHDPKVIYFGGNRLFISRDRGVTWERTEDLSRRIDRDTLRIMGVLGRNIALSRNDGTGSFGEIVTIAESPLEPKILWVGVDDGNLQVSRDGGRSWTEVSRNVRGVQGGTYVSRVIASAAGPGVAYASFDAHRDGDFAPYVFRTRDFGRTWQPLMNGLPSGSVNVVREHPRNPKLLFLGTEHALYVSADAGASWVELGSNLPTTLYDDLVIHPRDNDLIVGTHGRSIWILDDLAPLVEWSPEVARADAHLFSSRPAIIFQYWKDDSYRGNHEFVGENPPFGAIVSYYLGRPAPSAKLTVMNRRREVVRTLEGPATTGIQRVVWDLRHEPPPYEPGSLFAGEEQEAPPPATLPHPVTPQGPFVSPGTYLVTLEAGSTQITKEVVVKPDPFMPMLSQQDYDERERFLLALLALQRRTWEAGDRVDALAERLRAQVEAASGAADELRARAREAQRLERQIGRLRRELYGLAGELNGSAVRPGSLYPPTTTQRQRSTELAASLEQALQGLAHEEARAAGAR
ncbi:MAG: hypothetical protein HY704_06390 [Gemmatimonadetes bacterium]|nr:hypothetical protein [Gemmatimonadota bacterium]